MTWLARARPTATAAAVLATLCATATLTPLFASGAWVAPVLMIVLVMGAIGLLCRAAYIPAWLQPLLQVGALLIVLTVMFAQPAAALGVFPGPVALDELAALARPAVSEAQIAPVPVEVSTLLLFLSVSGIGFVALVVDTLGVTLRLPGFAGVPLLLVCALPIAVVPGGLSWWYLPVAVAGWLALLAVDVRCDIRSWGPQLVPRAHLKRASPHAVQRVSGGARPALIAISTALAVALAVPLLATGLAEPVYVSASGSGAGGTGAGSVSVDPFASLRRYLLDIPESEVLRYSGDGDARPYLRLVSLDNFDGVSWRASAQQDGIPATETLAEPNAPAVADVRAATYDITITGLDNEQLPVPYAASRVQGIGAALDPNWQWDPRARTITAAGLSSRGLAYQVTSYQVQPSRDELRGAPSEVDADVAELLALPEAITPDLGRLAADITADAKTPYAKALALVRWFTRDGDFSYSTTVTTPEGADPLQSFLDERVGYCQQFAGTMALMARAVGIPSRVIIGFTGGRQENGERVVYARNAHAWPELWFSGIGWVWFEPTPRADAGGGVTQPDYAQPRDDAGGTTTSGRDVTTNPDRRIAPEERGGGAPAAATQQPALTIQPRWLLVLAFVLVAIGFLPALAVIARRRRRTGSSDGVQRVEGTWQDLADAVRDLGWSWPLAATPRSAARILADQVRLDDAERAALTRLATAVERVRYAPGDAAATPEAASLRADLRRVRAAARRATHWRLRLRATVLPRSLRGAEQPLTVPWDESERDRVR